MKTQLIQNIWSLALVSATSVALLAGCQKIEYPAPAPSTAAANTSARVLFVNASNASSLTTYIENVQAGSALTPGGISAYLPIATNSSQIRVKGAGGTLASADLSAKQTFLANTSYTVFITDTITRPLVKNALGATTDPGGVRFVTVTDTLTAPAAGTAKLRFFNFAPNVASASARLISSAGTAAATLNGRAYRATAATSLPYTRVPAGTYTVQLYAASTAPTALTATPAASTTVTLADGKIYTLYSQGLRGLSGDNVNTLRVGQITHN